MHKQRKRTTAGIGVFVVILILCELASMTVLFGRMMSFSNEEFEHVLPLIENAGSGDIGTGFANVTYSTSEAAADDDSSSVDESASDGREPWWKHHPEFRMEAEVEIFKFSYDETGKVTVIGVEGNPDKLIAPGTSNLYQFTLANTGDVALDYTMSIEAFVTGTDLWLPVYARVWDYKNNYLAGSADEMVEVLEIDGVEDSGELGAGRNAVYSLEWEWPFERADENGDISLNDKYDTMLGNLAVNEDLTLHIVIRTYAEYDEEPDDPNSGLVPPQTGDDQQIVIFSLLGGISLVILLALIFASIRSGRKEKREKDDPAENPDERKDE